MSETNRFALLLWVAASLAVCCRAEGPNATGKQDEVGVPPKSPPLQNFFQTNHQPLSFSYFDRAAPAPSATIPASPKPAVLPRPDSINGTPFASATTMDSVMQGIRDLKLTIAEMEDKLDRVVQKVAPGPGGKSLMNKGADLFRKFLRLSTPGEENEEPVRLERAMNSMQTRGPRGVGLSYH
nr:PREDICTED: uncharacterized protein LOC109043611 [Bemisia tabaci]